MSDQLPHRDDCTTCDTARTVMDALRREWDPIDNWTSTAAGLVDHPAETVYDHGLRTVAEALHAGTAAPIDSPWQAVASGVITQVDGLPGVGVLHNLGHLSAVRVRADGGLTFRDLGEWRVYQDVAHSDPPTVVDVVRPDAVWRCP